MADVFRKYIKKQNHANIPRIRYKTNFTNCILSAFIRRGFQQAQTDDWDIVWSEKDNIPEIYEKRIQPHQRINHFRNYFQLCRKDLLIRNLKKHRKALERDGKAEQAHAYNFYPQTYVLPAEYMIFADDFKKQQQQAENKNVWIMKPSGRSQGKGIFLFNKLGQVSQWENHSAENYIVQRYISEPLLIGGKKFDIRIYVLVTGYSPLTVYLYRSGFARFTHCRYEEGKIQNSEIHLTNVAIQKNAEGYDDTIGGKWYLQKLKSYLISKYGTDRINASFLKIQEIIIKTLEAMQKVMSTDKQNSFQLYGFDVLLDSKLQPWLIEVNGSPSMTANTATDNNMKKNLMDDTLSVIDMQKFLVGNQEQIGGFDLIYKTQNKKSNSHNILLQKVSFLGTFNNRQQNLKKLAKNNALRLNNQYSTRRETQERKLLHHNQNTSVNSGSAAYGKRNTISRKTVKANHNRDFVIKQRPRRDENQPKEIR